MVPLFLHHYFRGCRVFSFLSFFASTYPVVSGFPGGASGEESTCQGRRFKRHGFNPWVRKIPWHRRWQPTSAFLSGKFHGQRRLAGYSQRGCKRVRHNWATERVHTHTHTHTHPMLSDSDICFLYITFHTVHRVVTLHERSKTKEWRVCQEEPLFNTNLVYFYFLELDDPSSGDFHNTPVLGHICCCPALLPFHFIFPSKLTSSSFLCMFTQSPGIADTLRLSPNCFKYPTLIFSSFNSYVCLHFM